MNDAPELTVTAFIAGWDLFRDSALSGAVAGALLGWLGVYVVLGRMVFLSAALSQAAGLGVAVALAARAWPGLPAWTVSLLPAAGAFSLTALAALVLAWVPGRLRDGLLGLVYTVGAAGTLAVGTRMAADVHEIDDILFGSAVAVLPDQLVAYVAIAVPALALHAWWHRGFIAAALDPESARVRGVPVRLLRLVLFGSLALAVSSSTRLLGALPVFALTVLPPLAALRVARSVPQALWLAASAGALCGLGGYVAAFLYRLPVGASQALAAAAVLALAAGAQAVVRNRPARARGAP